MGDLFPADCTCSEPDYHDEFCPLHGADLGDSGGLDRSFDSYVGMGDQ